MSIVKLAFDEDAIYARASAKAAAKYPKDSVDWKAVNKRAKSVTDRYAKLVKYVRNKNIKKAAIATTVAAAIAGGAYAGYKKSKKE